MFKVECKYDHKYLYLSVTHNEYQWTSIAIKNPKHEIPLIIKALENHLSEASTRPDNSCTCPDGVNNYNPYSPTHDDHGSEKSG